MSERSANGSLYAGHQYLYLPDEEATACGGEAIDACYVGDVVISAITFAELEYGALISANPLMQRRNLASMIQSIPVASFDAGAAIAYGAIRQATRERKRDQLDKLIAAHAVALGVTLVTNNVKDFSAYPGVQIENWLDEPSS